MMYFPLELATIILTICHNTEIQPFSLWLAKRANHFGKWLAIWHGKRPTASSNFQVCKVSPSHGISYITLSTHDSETAQFRGLKFANFANGMDHSHNYFLNKAHPNYSPPLPYPPSISLHVPSIDPLLFSLPPFTHPSSLPLPSLPPSPYPPQS